MFVCLFISSLSRALRLHLLCLDLLTAYLQYSILTEFIGQQEVRGKSAVSQSVSQKSANSQESVSSLSLCQSCVMNQLVSSQ